MVGTVEGATVVAGIEVDAVGGGGGASVVVVCGSVVGVVVAGGGGGGDVTGGVVPVFRGAVVATVGWVRTAPPPPAAAVVEVVSTVDDVDVLGPLDVVVGRTVVVVTRAVVDGDWFATCCLGEVSLPVTTSNRRAARAIDAKA